MTGDCFTMDKSGAFHFVARNDDMIISSGYNIAAPDVEAALLQHPFVDECAVIGVDDEDRGSIVQAHIVLVLDQAKNNETIEILQNHVKELIAPYKYPRSIVFCESIPKTATGKIQRFSLKK
jgi:2-aminobenzoate-CoA ligase